MPCASCSAERRIVRYGASSGWSNEETFSMRNMTGVATQSVPMRELPFERAAGDCQAAVAQLLKKFYLFRKWQCREPFARLAFAFQNFLHPVGHFFPVNLCSSCCHFATSW